MGWGHPLGRGCAGPGMLEDRRGACVAGAVREGRAGCGGTAPSQDHVGHREGEGKSCVGESRARLLSSCQGRAVSGRPWVKVEPQAPTATSPQAGPTSCPAPRPPSRRPPRLPSPRPCPPHPSPSRSAPPQRRRSSPGTGELPGSPPAPGTGGARPPAPAHWFVSRQAAHAVLRAGWPVS